MRSDDHYRILKRPLPGASQSVLIPQYCPWFPHPVPQVAPLGHDIDRCIRLEGSDMGIVDNAPEICEQEITVNAVL